MVIRGTSTTSSRRDADRAERTNDEARVTGDRYRGLRLMIPAAIVGLVAQAINVFGQVGARAHGVLQAIFFSAWVVGIVGLLLHYREMWRSYKERPKT